MSKQPRVDIRWNGAAVEEAMLAATEALVDRAAIVVEEEARDSLTRPKGGKSVGKFTRRSAPGEPPASQHGEAGLLGSIQTRKDGRLSRQVGTSLDYGLYLELGAPRANLAARPFLEAALMNKLTEIKGWIR